MTRHDFGDQAFLLLDEVVGTFQAHVPRRRVNHDPCPVGDVLAGDIFDIALERVAVWHARVALGLEIDRQVPAAVSVASLAAATSAHRLGGVVSPAHEQPAFTWECLADRRRRVVDRTLRPSPACTGRAPIDAPNRYFAAIDALHRSPAIDVAGANDDVDAEVGPAIRGDEKRSAHRLVVVNVPIGARTGRFFRANVLWLSGRRTVAARAWRGRSRNPTHLLPAASASTPRCSRR